MINYVLYVILAMMLIVFVKCVVFGKSLWDKLLGMTVISSKVIVIIILFASINEAAYLLDYAIVYALFGFVGAIFISLFLSKRSRRGNE